MAIVKIVSTQGTSSSGSPTTSVDTTGANFIVGGVGTASGGGSVNFTDNKSNTFTQISQQSDANVPLTQAMSWCAAPTVGSGHTFSNALFYECVQAIAFSGMHATPYDQSNGSVSGAAVTSFAAGSITPTVDGCLIVAHIAFGVNVDVSTVVVPSGFTLELDNTALTGVVEGAIAWMVQTTAAAINPSWSWTTADRAAATVASFKPSVAAPTTSLTPRRGGASFKNLFSM